MKNNDVIVRIFGGLGNQMFQYAAARAYSERNDLCLYLDLSAFKYDKKRKYCLDKFKINAKVMHKLFLSNKVLRKVMHYVKYARYYRNYTLVYDPYLSKRTGGLYLDGYFQSEQYFNSYKDVIRDELVPSFHTSDEFKSIKNEIVNSESVSIHVRRGDYLEKKNSEKHGVLGLQYYQQSIKILSQCLDNPKYFVFSDDVAWCKKCLLKTLDIDAEIVDLKSNEKDVEEMMLMSLCCHHIIANSSYSWWGAWLGGLESSIVVAPRKWLAEKETSGVISNNWIII